ncbi:MAG TPA: adenylate/guanylate cyclase domain-containing protein, partial [Myxococcaceae bacterium]|nr:adenylate/guanylate cyclase domain-containing protein [Myxococcaceae bacterium]
MTSGSSGARPAPHLSEVPREHRRLAAIMFTDMVGFSALAQRNETLTLELLEEHRRLLRGFFSRHGGREVKTTGDGFLVEFDSALDAVLCAVQLQESLAERNRLSIPERRVSVRVGIHLGDVIHRENDVFGDGVNIAARIEPLAEGGGVCISEDVYRQIRNKLDVPVTKLGRGELKNIQLPVEVYRVGMRGQKAGNPLVARARFLLRKKRTWAAFTLLLLVGLGAFGMRQGLFSRADPELDGPLAVAVADFVNETGEKDLDGLSGMLITSLEQSRKLSVMTRVRMVDVLEQLGRKGVDRIDEVLGRELCQHARANALVLGTVRRFGELYTLELKVLHPSRNEYLFTAREQGKGKESLPAMLDKLSEATRVALRENQAEIRKASAGVAGQTTTNFEAYQHYFKGEQLVARATSNTDIKAVLAARAEFQRAAALDPTFALAHWRIAWTQQWVHEDGSQALAQAIRYQDRAPEKERLYIRAFDAQARHQMDEAVARYQQVVAQYPHEKEAHFFLGDLQFHRSHLEPAIAHLRQALEIDPNFALVYDHLIDALTRARQFDLAKRYARQYLDRVPGHASAHWFIRPILIAEPLEQAERSLREARDAHPEQVDLVLAPLQVRALRGDLDGAELELRDLATSTRPQLRRGALRIQAWVATYRGRYREASRLLDLLAEEYKALGEWEPFGITLVNEIALVQVGWR